MLEVTIVITPKKGVDINTLRSTLHSQVRGIKIVGSSIVNNKIECRIISTKPEESMDSVYEQLLGRETLSSIIKTRSIKSS